MQNSKYIFEVINGSIMNHVTGCFLREPGVLILLDTGSPIKIGEYKFCALYMDNITKKLPADLVNDQYELVKFNIAYPEFNFAPEGYYLTVDEICTLFNYLQNFTIGSEGWAKLKAMSLDELKTKLAQIKTWLEY